MRLRSQLTILVLGLGLGLGALSGPAAGAARPTTSDGTWAKVSTTGTGPSDRSVPAVAGVGSALVVFGGVEDDFSTGKNTFFDDLYRLDTVSGTWTQIPREIVGPWPAARAFAAATSSATQFFVFGGSQFSADGSEFTVFDDLWVLSGRAWQRLPSGPSARSGSTLWFSKEDKKLYLFGGIDQTFSTLNDLWSFDLSTNKWAELVPDGQPGSPPSRHAAQAGQVAVNGTITLYGGEGPPPTFEVLNDTWTYDIATGDWSDIGPAVPGIEPGRNYAAAGVIGDDLYVQGGDVPGGEAGCGAPFPQNPVEELWRLDLPSKTWKQLSPAGDKLVRLKRHSAAAVRGKLYVVNGWDFQCSGGVGPGQVWNTSVYAFTP